ncbi:MAG: hypothetical protein JW924_12285 [Fusobacteriaceae bacterium]|nr:hypothetical protein [Fusobacteriaceae bacterium]
MAKERINKFANIVRGTSNVEDTKEVMKELVHHEIKTSELRFDYSKLEIDDNSKEELIDIERELKHHQDRFRDLSLDMGKALNNAREIFIKSHSESFMEWYESLGFNKSQVSALVNKYKLLLEFPEKEENIIILTDKQVLEITNKKTPEHIKERIILQGENISAAEIKRERQKNISTRMEKFSDDIQEAELVESLNKFIIGEQCILNALKTAMEKIKKGSNTKENLEKLKKVQDILESVE